MEINAKEVELPKTYCILCKNFYGSKQFDEMCSVCYKKSHPQSEIKKEVKKQEAKIQKEDPQPDKTRCYTCRKKVGLLGIKCKCQLTFCNQHRMPQNHQCNIDYKKIAEEKLKKENVIVKNQKVQQI